MDKTVQSAGRETNDSIQVMYVFADVEGFTSHNRTNEAQGDIIRELNEAFREATKQFKKTIFLPTGDGICAGITDLRAPYDAHLTAAIAVLNHIEKWSTERKGTNRACRVRLGINEAKDYPVKDINGRNNLAGAGINFAQRVMSLCDGNQIVASERAHANLRVRDTYERKFRRFKAEIKHGQILTAYQYIDDAIPALNVTAPTCSNRADSIDLSLAEAIDDAQPEGLRVRITAIRQAYAHAIEARMAQIEETLALITKRLNKKEVSPMFDVQNKGMLAALLKGQDQWTAYFTGEKGYIKELDESFWGARSASKRIYEVVRERARALREYKEWTDSDEDRCIF